jgi:hypothetical protein
VAKTLAALIERARAFTMSPKQREEQRRSFAFGNTKIENDLITLEMIDEIADTELRKSNG